MTATKVEPKVVHATFVVERSLSKPTATVFAALSDTRKVQRWMAPGSHSELIEFSHDFQEGGQQFMRYKMGPSTPIAGAIITNEVRFQQIVPGERIVTVSTMKMDGRIFSASQVTFELMPTEAGTDLILTHQGAFFEGSDGPAGREHGWNVLADSIVALLNEPETQTAGE